MPNVVHMTTPLAVKTFFRVPPECAHTPPPLSRLHLRTAHNMAARRRAFERKVYLASRGGDVVDLRRALQPLWCMQSTRDGVQSGPGVQSASAPPPSPDMTDTPPPPRVASPFASTELGDGVASVAQVTAYAPSALDFHTREEFMWTPLHAAAYFAHDHIVQMLLASGADINSHANNAWTPLHVAVIAASDVRVENVVPLLETGEEGDADVTGWATEEEEGAEDAGAGAGAGAEGAASAARHGQSVAVGEEGAVSKAVRLVRVIRMLLYAGADPLAPTSAVSSWDRYLFPAHATPLFFARFLGLNHIARLIKQAVIRRGTRWHSALSEQREDAWKADVPGAPRGTAVGGASPVDMRTDTV
ncbi:ankyrin repeat domain-containing protein, partial [archaeon]